MGPGLKDLANPLSFTLALYPCSADVWFSDSGAFRATGEASSFLGHLFSAGVETSFLLYHACHLSSSVCFPASRTLLTFLVSSTAPPGFFQGLLKVLLVVVGLLSF